MACNESLEILRELLKIAKKYLGTGDGERGYTPEGWSYYRIGKSVFYERSITYDGNAASLDLQFPVATQVNRIEQIWNDATVKDAEVRVYSNPSSAYYIVLDSVTANPDTSRLLQLGLEYKYTATTMLRLYYATNTNGKILMVRVQADDL